MKRKLIYAFVLSTAVMLPAVANAAADSGMPSAGTAPGTSTGEYPPTESARLGDQSMSPPYDSNLRFGETDRRDFSSQDYRRESSFRGNLQNPMSSTAGSTDLSKSSND